MGNIIGIVLVVIFLFLIYLGIGKKQGKPLEVERRNSIFDLTEDADHLTIRYLYLKDEKKSGDAIFIRFPNGKNMLIDSGKVATSPQVVDYLKRLKVEKIDYAIATHPHHDHIGGYLTVLKEIEVNQIWMPNVPHTTTIYTDFMEIIKQKGIPVQYVEEGDCIHLADETFIQVLNPPKGTGPDLLPSELSVSMINNLNLVLMLHYKNMKFLFTADLYKEREYGLVEEMKDALKANFMDAPHHGDDTSSSIDFIEAVDAAYVVISANVIQSEVIYHQYQKLGKKVYAMFEHGNILVKTNGEYIKVLPEIEKAFVS